MSKDKFGLDDHGSWIWMDKDAREPNLVLFIHGYTGHADATWVQFPNLIMRAGEGFDRDFEVASFGYRSQFLLNLGIDIGSLAERFLTFIDAHAHENTNVFIVAHSLGGLVIRRFLVETFNQPSRREFFRKIKQVHFIGVPHRGAAVLLIVQRLLNRLLVWAPKLFRKPNPLAAELRWGSPLLLDTLHAWEQVLKACLQEGIAPPAIFNYVGDKDSIAPPRSVISDSSDREDYRVLDGDHIDIAKPRNPANTVYKLIKRRILKVAKEHQRGLSMARELPETFVERPVQLNQLLDYLFDRVGKKPVASTTALYGPPGFGKTTLAVAFCNDHRVRTAFADGILWATLGHTPNIPQELSKLYAALTGDRLNFVDEDDAAHNLTQKLKDKNCLIVIDDVWDRVHLQPFLRCGKGCSRLFTTRQFEIAREGKLVKVAEMTGNEAVKILTTQLSPPPRLIATFETLARRLGHWPLLLKLVAATLKQRRELGEEIDRALAHVNAALDRRSVIAFDRENPSGHAEAVAGAVEVSLAGLRGDQRLRYIELAILPEDADIPLATVGALWSMDEFDTDELLVRLNDCSLLDFNLRTRTVGLHAVINAYLKSQLANPISLHGRLLDTWGDLCHLPNAYAWRWIAYHLAQAERKDQLRKLLLNPDWLHAKLEATDVNSVIADFDVLQEDDALRLIKEALKLSAHILVKEKTQIRTQLYGRLLPYEEGLIQILLETIKQQKSSPWLRPVTPTLAVPGGQLLRTLFGHGDSVEAVSILSQARKVISASWDRTLRVWDLESGIELFKLVGHDDAVNAVAALPDESKVISASWDCTVKVWDMESEEVMCTLTGHSKGVKDVDLLPNGRHAVSGSEDRTVKVWNLVKGREVRTLNGHSDAVNAVAVLPDGRRAISGSDDRTVKVWDLVKGREVRTLSGHNGAVNAVAVLPDGRHTVSASKDRTLKVWNLAEGREVLTLRRHGDAVSGVAVSPDGQQAVSASKDRTLMVWNLEGKEELPGLTRHAGTVFGVTANKEHAISASWDHDLKVWDLNTGREIRTLLPRHNAAVNAVAMTPNGQDAISASSDGTLILWNLRNPDHWRKRKILHGHDSAVWSVAITLDGWTAVSGSEDCTVKVWNLGHEKEVRTLEGHTDAVTAVDVAQDGLHTVSGSRDCTLKVWDVGNGGELCRFECHNGPVSSVVITPDGKRAISGSADQTVRVWNLETGRELHTLKGHVRQVTAVALTPDGRRVVSVSADGAVKVWDLHDGALITSFYADGSLYACAVAGDGATIVIGEGSGLVHFLRMEGIG